jgi:hypothetical protein
MNFEWIPQLFMDFIGRVIPGALILIAARVVQSGQIASINTSVATDKGEIAWAGLLLWLLISYFLGFCLTQVWRGMFGLITYQQSHKIEMECKSTRVAEHNQIQKLLGGKPLPLAPEQLPEIFVMHDYLRVVVSREASRLLKLQSERRICHCIIIGFGILCVVNAVLMIRNLTGDRVLAELCMIGAVVALWFRMFRLQRYFANGVCVLWLALVSTGRLPGTLPLDGEQTAGDKSGK